MKNSRQSSVRVAPAAIRHTNIIPRSNVVSFDGNISAGSRAKFSTNNPLGRSSVSWSATENRGVQQAITPSSNQSLSQSYRLSRSSQEPRRESLFNVTSGFFGNSSYDQPASTTKKEYPRIVNHSRLFSTATASSSRSMEDPMPVDLMSTTNMKSLAEAAHDSSASLRRNPTAHQSLQQAHSNAMSESSQRTAGTSPEQLEQYLKEKSMQVARMFGGYEIGPVTRNLMDNDEENMKKPTSPVYPLRSQVQQLEHQAPRRNYITSGKKSESPNKSAFIVSPDRIQTPPSNVTTESKRGYHLGVGKFLYGDNDDEKAQAEKTQVEKAATKNNKNAAGETQRTKPSKNPNLKSSSSIYMSSYTMRNGRGDFNVVRGYAENDSPTEYKVTRGIISEGTPKVTKTFTTTNPEEISFDDVSRVDSQIENKRQQILNQSSPNKNSERKPQQMTPEDSHSPVRSPEPLGASTSQPQQTKEKQGFKQPTPLPPEGSLDMNAQVKGEPDHMTHCVDGICITSPKKDDRKNQEYTSHFD